MPRAQIQFQQQDGREAQILIVDDHPIVVAGFRRLLLDAGWTNVDHTPSFADAFRRCRQSQPGAVVVDLAMNAGALSGLSFVQRMRRCNLEVPILVLTMHSDPLIARAALKAGANGYVVKDTSPEEIVQGLSSVLEGTPYVSRVLASDLAFLKARQPGPSAIDALSSRERYILSLLAEGRSYAQIADALALSYKSVAHVCNRLKPKLGVHSLQELVHFAVQNSPTITPVTHAFAKRSKKSG